MKTIHIQLKKVVDNSYAITVGEGLLARLPNILKESQPASGYVVIADETTARLFGRELLASLRASNLKAILLPIPAGESSKSQKHKTELEQAMLKADADRRSVVLALGGGVVGDIAGFVAATYMRGIPYIQLPTTLLAMVDSSIGGKTGIDTRQGKNLIGAFHQPSAVLADVNVLKNLPDAEIRNGLIEAAKMYITSDAESFTFLERNLDKALARDLRVLSEVISRAVSIKAGVVERDEREGGERTVLNFGHTIGHALEKLSDYALPHGQAVAVGIAVETELAYNLGRLSKKDLSAIQTILKKLQAPISVLEKFSLAEIVKATKGDKKSIGGQTRCVILKEIGKVEENEGRFVEIVSDSELKKAIFSVIPVKTRDQKALDSRLRGNDRK
jgi:3-dehydroquinate synthase